MQNSIASKNSSKPVATQTLARVTIPQMRRFLVGLANLMSDGKSIAKFQGQYNHFMPRRLSASAMGQATLLRIVFDNEIKVPIEIFMLQNGLRNIWQAEDSRTKAWGIFRLIDEIEIQLANPPSLITLGALSWSSGKVMTLPAPSAFEQAMEYLRNNGHLAHVCANPECPAPYFLAIRKSQKYCNADCATPSQREFKRKWWVEHGRIRRAEAK
jgi:hypothetical protein